MQRLLCGALARKCLSHADGCISTGALPRKESKPGIAAGAFLCMVRTLTENTSTKTETPQTNSHIEIEGKVVAVLPGTMFRVQIGNGHIVLAHISGKLRKHFIKIAAGDTVRMEMSPYDTDKARITYRAKDTGYRPPPRRRR